MTNDHLKKLFDTMQKRELINAVTFERLDYATMVYCITVEVSRRAN